MAYRVAGPLEDVLRPILEHLADDYPTLLRCSLVDHAFNRVASAILYRKLIFAPRFTRGLDLATKAAYSVSDDTYTQHQILPYNVLTQKLSLINSSYQPHNAGYVRELQIGGG